MSTLFSHLHFSRLLQLGLFMAIFSATGCALHIVNALTPGANATQVQGIAYGDHPRHKLDLYRPAEGKNFAIVMFIHGGYWSSGERAEYRFVGETLAKRGYLAAIISYRLYPEVRFPGFIEDAASAVAKLRNIARQYGGDPQRLYVGGHSAGAHSAMMLALDERYLGAEGGSPEWLRGVFGLSGPYDFLPPKAKKVAAIFGPSERYPQGNTVNFVSVDHPPTLLIHGRDDTTVSARNSQQLAELLRESGNRADLLISNGGHVAPLLAFSGFKRKRSEVLQALDSWIASTPAAAPVEEVLAEVQ